MSVVIRVARVGGYLPWIEPAGIMAFDVLHGDPQVAVVGAAVVAALAFLSTFAVSGERVFDAPINLVGRALRSVRVGSARRSTQRSGRAR